MLVMLKDGYVGEMIGRSILTVLTLRLKALKSAAQAVHLLTASSGT
jgi:hypothetical protein